MKKYFKKVFCDRETYILTIIFIPLVTILACLDYKDVIVGYIFGMDWKLSLIICIGFIVFGFVIFFGNHFTDLFSKIVTVNILDRVLALFITSDVAFFAFLKIINQDYIYKCFVLIITFIIFLLLIIYRGIRYSCHKKANKEAMSKVYDLKEFLEMKSDQKINCPILISEKDIDYDLFDRKEMIFQLETAIEISCKSDNPFVIGLSGKWGSGKTTIINNVKKQLMDKDDIIVIDSFDPWKYASSKAMLMGMYCTILQNTGVKYSDSIAFELFNTVCDLVAEAGNTIGKAGKLAKIMLSQERDNDSIDGLKEEIDEYLKLKNKNIVFIIDNLDRATAENVRFVFKLVGAVFDFERVKYVLSYDKDRLSEIFRDSLQIDPRYMEKIINQELSVPKISKESREKVYRKGINNLLLSYGVDSKSLSDFEYIISFIVDYVQDIRMFKRLLNSAFFLSFGKNNLYKPDLLTLEVIRFLDIELYESIYQNKRFFIDADIIYDVSIYPTSIDTKRFNMECKTFYDNMFENKEQYKKLLSNLFPYVDHYTKNNEIKQDSCFRNPEEHKKTQLHSRINSAKFFDLYFCYSLNDYSEISAEFNELFREILFLSEEEILDKVSKHINGLPVDSQNEWASKLYLSKDDINESVAYPVLISLFENIQSISEERGFLTISPRERVVSVMANLFKKIGATKQKRFLTIYANNIKTLFVITKMVYWLKDSDDEETKNSLINCAKNICDEIFGDDINIYDDLYYIQGNIWSVYHTLQFCDTQDFKQILKSYIAKILTPKIIYRVLRDTVGSSIGAQYGYYIVKEDFEVLFDKNTSLQELLDKNIPNNDSEKLIYDLYQDYVKYSGNVHPEHMRCFISPFVFDL